MRCLLSLLLLVSLASAALPSDEIQHISAPGMISLQNVDPAAPKLFAAQDANLSMFGLTELPNLGHYCTWADVEVQKEATLTDSQKSVLQDEPSNDTGENITVINSTTAEGLVYL